MSIEIIHPKDEAEWHSLRREVVTSTEVAALFDASPYTTLFELWHRKRDKSVVSIEANDRMKWGTRLQDAIAAGVAEDNGWTIRKVTEYIRDTDLRAGASFDFFMCGNPPSDGGNGILEIKNVDSLAFRDGWLIDGDNVEAPAHIEFQVQHQLMVAGKDYAYIGALIGGNKVQLIRRERDEKAIEAIKARVKDFWASIDANVEPTPDFSRDSKFIASLYGFANPGTEYAGGNISLLRDLVVEYKRLGEIEKEAKSGKDALKAKILMEIGTSEKVKGDTFSISAGMIGPAEVSYTREGYRDFRVFTKKEKVKV